MFYNFSIAPLHGFTSSLKISFLYGKITPQNACFSCSMDHLNNNLSQQASSYSAMDETYCSEHSVLFHIFQNLDDLKSNKINNIENSLEEIIRGEVPNT